MIASEYGSDDWWLVVLSMPAYEALEYLCRYRSLLLENSLGTSAYTSSVKKITRINDEIKIRNRRINDAQWQQACKKMLNPELYDEVAMYVSITRDNLKLIA